MIQQSLYDWMTLVNPGVAVKMAPYSGERPAGDYITYQILTIVPMVDGYKHTYTLNAGNLYDWTRINNAEMRVSINAYSPNGIALLNNLQMSNDWWQAKQTLKADGDDIAFVDATGPQNLTGLGDEGYRSRYQMDARFHMTISNTRTKYEIQQWALTGDFGDVESAINYPQ